MKKRMLALFLAIVMLFGLVACGKEQPEATETPVDTAPVSTEPIMKEETELAPLTLPLTTEDKTITIALQQNSMCADYDNNYLTKYIKEQTGIQIEFVLLPEEDPNTKWNLMVSSGEELPDILMLNTLTEADITAFGEDGVFLDLAEKFEKDANWCFTVPYMTEDNWQYIMSTNKTADGKLYGFPVFQSSYGGSVQYDWQINTEWLDAVGMDMPTNTDELLEVLRAFRDKDPNGNGKKDEIPYHDISCWNSNTEHQLINAFVYFDVNYPLNATDGQLWAPYITEDYQEAMKYLNTLVSEGLMSDLSFTTTAAESILQLDTADGECIIGLYGSSHHTGMYNVEENIYKYDYMGTPAGPKGVKYSPNRPDSTYLCGFITRDCEDVDLAFALLDWLSTQYNTYRFGERGVNWVAREDDPEAFDEKYPYLNMLGETIGADHGFAVVYDPVTAGVPEDDSWIGAAMPFFQTGFATSSECLSTPAYSTREDIIANDSPVTVYLDYLYYAKQDRRGLLPDEVVYKIKYTTEELEEVGSIEVDLMNYVKECISLFAMGEMDPVEDWDTYVNNLYAMGLEDYLAVSQTAYDRMMQ